MKTKLFSLSALLVLIGLIACKKDNNTPQITASPGTANFSTYVAVGNSLTSGFADNALYLEGQQNSYPSIIAKAMSYAGGGAFNQPLLLPGDGFGGFSSTGAPLGRLVLVGKYGATFNPVPTALRASTSPLLSSWRLDDGSIASLNNFGVPGATIQTALAPGYGDATYGNPFFTRFAKTIGSLPGKTGSSMITDAAARKPTFFTYWLGSNDVLGYVLAGGVHNPAGTGQDTITDIAHFTGALAAGVGALLASGNSPKGAIANIPDVTSIPNVTYIKYNSSPVARQGQADSINGGWAMGGIATTFGVGDTNRFVIITKTGVRQATSGDYILLSAQTDALAGKGTSPLAGPLPDKDVLDKDEVAKAKAAVTAFNSAIASYVAANPNLVLVDMNTNLTNLVNNGITASDGAFYNASFPFGGIFSLDGVHLTPKGYAQVANYYIQAINTKFGSTLPLVNIDNYRGPDLSYLTN